MHFLSQALCHIASSIPFALTDLVVHYGTKIAKELRRTPKPSPSANGPTAPVAPVQIVDPQPVPLPPVQKPDVP